MNADRNPNALWAVVGKMCREEQFRSNLEIKLIGSTDVSVINSLELNGLMNNVEVISYLPHAEVIRQTRSAQLLLLPLNDTPNVSGIIPGKLYEYLASRRPILCIGPSDGDSARIISESQSGMIVGFEDEKQMGKVLEDCYAQFMKEGSLKDNEGEIAQYSRKSLAGKMAAVLDSVI
jgi:hypothetical protein